MRRRYLTLLILLLSAPPASAVELTGADTGRWQHWADTAHVPTVRGPVELEITRNFACASPDAAACTTFPPARIQINPTAGNQPRLLLYHELGHVFDAEELTDAQRLAFMLIWHRYHGGSIAAAWWQGNATEDPLATTGPPAEWFAEGYRLCATWRAWTWNAALASWTLYGYPAEWLGDVDRTPAEQRWAARAQNATCALIRSIRVGSASP